jgi:hypothetical protein
MHEQPMQQDDTCVDPIHELWLIYCRLKDAETDPDAREQLLSSARTQLGCVLNALNRFQLVPKSPGTQAANLNCRDRRKGLTPDIRYL